MEAEVEQQVALQLPCRRRRRRRARGTSGCTASPPRCAMRCTSLALVDSPARRRARRPPRRSGARTARGSLSDRSTSAPMLSRSRGALATEERLGVLVACSSATQPVDVVRRRATKRDHSVRREPQRERGASRRRRRACRYRARRRSRISTRPAIAGQPNALAEEDRAVGERDRRHEVRHERGIRRRRRRR